MDVELSLTGRASCLRLAGKHDPAGRNRCQSARESRLHKVFHIDIPLIWSSVRVSIVMIVTGIIKMFDTVYILTPNGGPGNCTNVPALLMYNESFKYNKYGKGSAIATVILGISIAVSILCLRITRQKEDY